MFSKLAVGSVCALAAAPSLASAASIDVAELADPNWKVAYTLSVPATFASNWNTVAVPYTINNSATITEPFDRVGYYMELGGATAANTPNGWVFVSFDKVAGMTSVSKVGVPNGASTARYQQNVTNLNVSASANLVTANTITPGVGLSTGNIEFWHSSYGVAALSGVSPANASTTAYDIGDTPNTGNGHGSMQIHNHGAGAGGQTLFSFGRWGNAPATTGVLDIGIGNRVGSANTDWTSSNSASLWTSRTIEVYVHVPEPGTAGVAGLAALGLLARRRRER